MTGTKWENDAARLIDLHNEVGGAPLSMGLGATHLYLQSRDNRNGQVPPHYPMSILGFRSARWSHICSTGVVGEHQIYEEWA